MTFEKVTQICLVLQNEYTWFISKIHKTPKNTRLAISRALLLTLLSISEVGKAGICAIVPFIQSIRIVISPSHLFRALPQIVLPSFD